MRSWFKSSTPWLASAMLGTYGFGYLAWRWTNTTAFLEGDMAKALILLPGLAGLLLATIAGYLASREKRSKD